MKILFATDHAGFKLKEKLIPFVKSLGYEVEDYGAYEYDENDDYPDAISKVASEVSDNSENINGIILGGSGQGEAITANRFPNVRAIVFNGQCQLKDGVEVPNEIIISREHNDANVLSLGARFLSEESAKEAVRVWLKTEFSGDERHKRRIAKIDEITKRILIKDDFDKWNEVKKRTQETKKNIYFKERDVFYINNGKNIGSEQNGNGKYFARPVIVFRKINKHVFIGIPLTTKIKKIPLRFHLSVQGKSSSALISQIRTFDSKRMLKKIDVISINIFNDLKKEISALLVH